MEVEFVRPLRGPCPASARIGRNCAFCGGTRAWRRAMRGDLSQAFKRHPAGALAGIATWGLILGAVGSLITGRPRYAAAGIILAAGFMTPAMTYQTWIVWAAFLSGS
ncbi:MAG: DUF2752 domain-containing protein [Vicinamibacteria bacterium]|nr:DUF2752 domain-containing protein [Vicinamibacteria bacterium]